MDSVMDASSDVYLIGKGKISGTYCDYFWKINSEGKVGYEFCRYPFAEEIQQMLNDIGRHRTSLLQELDELEKAEQLLNAAQEDENLRSKTPKDYYNDKK